MSERKNIWWIVPPKNWADELALVIRECQSGDFIGVKTQAQLDLAQRALERAGKQGVIVYVAEGGVQ